VEESALTSSSTARAAWKVFGAFLLSGCMGPLIRLAFWWTSPYWAGAPFVDDLVWLLWPTNMLAVIEASIGTPLAVSIAIGSNLILYGIVGLIVACIGRWTFLLLICWVACLGALAGWAWIGSGEALTHLDWRALLVGAVLCSVPFGIAGHAFRGQHGQP
jgi:hypothetical protein